MWFRILQIIAILSSWAVVARMLGHVSLRPVLFGRYSLLYAGLILTAVAVAVAASSTLRPSIYQRLFHLRYQILLSICSTLVAGLGTAEAAIRAFDLFGASFYQEVTRCMLDFEDDPNLAFRHKAGLRTTYQKVPVVINELGLRDRPIEPKTPERRRLLLLGDSVTFGWGVPIEDTYGRQLEKVLANSGVNAETVNSGVCGYNTVQQEAFLSTRGDRIDPDGVLLLFVDNDVQPVEPIKRERTVALWQDGPSSLISRLLRESWLYRIFYHLVPFVLAKPAPPPVADGAWRDSMQAIRNIDAYCRKKGIFFAPFLFRMSRNPHTDAILRSLDEVAVQGSFRVHDTQPWFANLRPSSLVNSMVDAHPNAAGHRVLAAGMAAALLEDGVFRNTPR